MSTQESNAPTAMKLWHPRRFWFPLWLAGSTLLTAFVLWDAWPWLQDLPHASFRSTRLNTWPVELLWYFLLPVIFWLQKNLSLTDRRWPWTLALHATTAAAITGFFLFTEALRIVVSNHLPGSFLSVVLNDLLWMEHWSYMPALIYLLLMSGLYAADFYRQWRDGQLLTTELQVANARLETRLVRASLDALKMQLHPHFLFNTLNSITSLIRNDRTREAEEVVAGLGELLRRSLQHRQEALEPLEDDLEFLHHYLEIESIRFQDRLKVEIDIAQDCLCALVPSLMLQPLVENAMKHGFSRDQEAALLRISAVREGSLLRLCVYNDGPPLPRDAAVLNSGIGIQNTRARLQMLYGGEACLTLCDQPPRGVRAEISLPFNPRQHP